MTLSGLGLAGADRTALQCVAERSLAEGETAHNEPFEVSTAMMLDAIVAADALGRARGPSPEVRSGGEAS
jgi:glycerol dehydrogenase